MLKKEFEQLGQQQNHHLRNKSKSIDAEPVPRRT